MNYQEMSDRSIDLEVFQTIFGKDVFTKDADLRRAWGRGISYCKSWTDAGRIIQDNDISIIKLQTKWMAISPGSGVESYLGEDDEPCLYGEGFEYKNENPLRAAMIVFLMMKGDA